MLAAAGTLLVLGNDSAVPAADAHSWIVANASTDQRLVVADTMTGPFVDAGWDAANVVDYDDLTAWRDADYVVAGPTAAAEAVGTPLDSAIANSVIVASFGEGPQRLDVRMVTPEGTVLAAAAQEQAAADRLRFGSELAQNPALQISDGDRELLSTGRVDPRVVILLATLSANGGITVGDFPIVDGEQAGPIRQVAVTKLAGERVAFGSEFAAANRDVFDTLGGPYAPDAVTAVDDTVVLTYAPTLDPLAD